MKAELSQLVDYYTGAALQVLGVYHYRIPPKQSGRMSTAPFPGFIFPLSGRAHFVFEGSPYTAGVGNVIHGGANMRLDKNVIGNVPWQYILVLYQIRKPEPVGSELEKSHFQLETGESPRLAELLQRLWQKSSQPGAIATFQTETLFRSVLEEVFICSGNQTGGSDRLLFQQASDYIHQYYMDPLTIRGLARLHHVNENRLFYVFNKYAGMGPGDYLMLHRLNRARELLVTGDAPIIRVAGSVGYADPYHFSKIFKNRYGLPPSLFRQQFRNNPCSIQDGSISM
ncbi:MAG: AraC family transcriptional regulator [Paenibacillaceae bacterium]|jgi:AraC-like DNA-binding protein|nr:AraC family transcriptional regulator [Paenibacillaceae bacterium]